MADNINESIYPVSNITSQSHYATGTVPNARSVISNPANFSLSSEFSRIKALHDIVASTSHVDSSVYFTNKGQCLCRDCQSDLSRLFDIEIETTRKELDMEESALSLLEDTDARLTEGCSFVPSAADMEVMQYIETSDIQLKQLHQESCGHIATLMKQLAAVDADIATASQQVHRQEGVYNDLNESLDESTSLLASTRSEIGYLRHSTPVSLLFGWSDDACNQLPGERDVESINGLRVRYRPTLPHERVDPQSIVQSQSGDTARTILVTWPEINAAWSCLIQCIEMKFGAAAVPALSSMSLPVSVVLPPGPQSDLGYPLHNALLHMRYIPLSHRTCVVLSTHLLSYLRDILPASMTETTSMTDSTSLTCYIEGSESLCDTHYDINIVIWAVYLAITFVSHQYHQKLSIAVDAVAIDPGAATTSSSTTSTATSNPSISTGSSERVAGSGSGEGVIDTQVRSRNGMTPEDPTASQSGSMSEGSDILAGSVLVGALRPIGDQLWQRLVETAGEHTPLPVFCDCVISLYSSHAQQHCASPSASSGSYQVPHDHRTMSSLVSDIFHTSRNIHMSHVHSTTP